jgi:MarR family transcriptional regulator, organic hydroperoxide resistance regulator
MQALMLKCKYTSAVAQHSTPGHPVIGEDTADDSIELVDELADLVSEMADQLRRHFAKAAAGLGLPPGQACALNELDGPLAMRELAERMGCEPSNVTFVIDRLETRGLVERHPDPHSRRTKQLILTPAGEQLRRQLRARAACDPPPLAALSQRQQHQLRALLTQALHAARTSHA